MRREGEQLSGLRGEEGAGAKVDRLQGGAATKQREALLRHLHTPCQADVCEALSQGGDGGGERVHRLVGDVGTLAQVQPAQVRNVTHQQAGRSVRQVQTGQSQVRHVLETPHSGFTVSCPRVRWGGQQLSQVGVFEVLHSAEVQQPQAGTDGLTQSGDGRPRTAGHVQLQQTL